MSEVLWQPSAERIAGSNLVRFMSELSARHGLTLSDYDALYAWSLAHQALEPFRDRPELRS